MNTNTKILFLDLDGTLLNDEKKITPGNAGAIQEALAAGHKIVINTGRASSSALRLAKQLGLNLEGCYIITFNGACIFDAYRDTPIYQCPVDRSYVRYIMDTAKAMELHAQTYDKVDVVCQQDHPDLQEYLRITGMSARIVPDVCAALTEDPYKVLVLDYAQRGKLAQFQQKIGPWAVGKVDHFYSTPFLLEMVAAGVSKGNAIRKLCRHLDIPLENTIAAGDAENDISMIETAHVGVVMKNAAPSMYLHGNYITQRDNNHDAIEEIIRKFIL